MSRGENKVNGEPHSLSWQLEETGSETSESYATQSVRERTRNLTKRSAKTRELYEDA